MKIDEWCQMHGITKANYYWRLRKVREALLEAADITPAFVELPAPIPASTTSKVVAILKGTNHLTLEITDQASPSFLSTLLGAMNHAQ